MNRLTAIEILLHHIGNLALVPRGNVLSLETRSGYIGMRVHGALKRITLPAKHVVGVGAVALGTLEAEHERVGAVLRPHVLELRGIPEGLVSYLWHADRVGRWAWTGDAKGLLLGVKHMRLVVG